jgi:hypothetical protein
MHTDSSADKERGCFFCLLNRHGNPIETPSAKNLKQLARVQRIKPCKQRIKQMFVFVLTSMGPDDMIVENRTNVCHPYFDEKEVTAYVDRQFLFLDYADSAWSAGRFAYRC